MAGPTPIATLHAPHGTSSRVIAWLDGDEWPCPKCGETFPALCALNRHVREKHNEPKGLVR